MREAQRHGGDALFCLQQLQAHIEDCRFLAQLELDLLALVLAAAAAAVLGFGGRPGLRLSGRDFVGFFFTGVADLRFLAERPPPYCKVSTGLPSTTASELPGKSSGICCWVSESTVSDDGSEISWFSALHAPEPDCEFSGFDDGRVISRFVALYAPDPPVESTNFEEGRSISLLLAAL